MINKTLTYIKGYLSDKLKADEWSVELGPIPKEGQPVSRDILITLLHIEEERDAKSQGLHYHYHKNDSGKTVAVTGQNPEIKLNLYILISSQKEQYETALKQISQVIGIFQVKNVFEKEDINKEGLESLILDLYPLTFEQNNSLWQTLGATMMPSVMYKVRTIVIQEGKETDPALIEKVEIRIKNKDEKEKGNKEEGNKEED